MNLIPCFEAIIGISTGAAIAAYGMASLEQAILGTSIYYEDCCEHPFINFLRNPIADIDFIEGVLRSGGNRGRKKLDVAAIRHARPAFYVGVTDAERGIGALINAKEADQDLIGVVIASLTIAGFYHSWRTINGIRAVDGSIGFPFPAREIEEQLHPTDMLVLANRSRLWEKSRRPILEKLASPFLLRGLPPPLRSAIRSRYQRFSEGLQYLRIAAATRRLNTGVIWGPENVHALTQNPQRLRAAAESGARAILEAFCAPHLSVPLL